MPNIRVTKKVASPSVRIAKKGASPNVGGAKKRNGGNAHSMPEEANVDESGQKIKDQRYGNQNMARELRLQIELEIKVSETNEANMYMPYARTKSANRPPFSGLRSLDGRRTKLHSRSSAPG